MKEFSYLDKFIYCEFIVTFLCNNKCPYCFWAGNLTGDAFMYKQRGPWLPKQRLSRSAFDLLRKLKVLKYTDAFRNYPLQTWQELFAQIFKDRIAYLSFTGGEPLIHQKNLLGLMRTLADVSEDFVVRFDTNGSIVPDFPPGLREKISYNISYHRSQISLDKFLDNLSRIAEQGRILMINRVVHHEDEMSEAIREMEFFAARNLFLNINPAFFDIRHWKQANIDLLKTVTHPLDYGLKIEQRVTGKSCKYPIFGFQLLPSGYAWVPPCSSRTVNLMKTKRVDDVLIRKAIKCPSKTCVCLHQYSFTEGIRRNAHSYDIMDNFVREHIQVRKERGS